jgi:hypothetical protein
MPLVPQVREQVHRDALGGRNRERPHLVAPHLVRCRADGDEGEERERDRGGAPCPPTVGLLRGVARDRRHANDRNLNDRNLLRPSDSEN